MKGSNERTQKLEEPRGRKQRDNSCSTSAEMRHIEDIQFWVYDGN